MRAGQQITALVRPPRLVPGDRVAVVAPSGPLDEARLRRGTATLASWGLDVALGAHVLDRERHLAGTDRDRAADFEAAWADPSIAAVLCARGGSGAARLLDLVDWSRLRRAEPKVLVGFSDVTALHEAVASHLGASGLFGPMPATEVFAGDRPDEATAAHLRATLFDPDSTTTLSGPDTAALVGGRSSGVLVGGTLSVLAAAVGSPEHRRAAGGIAILEDVGEAPYRLDVSLTQLLRTGWFDGVRGVVLGTWAGCGPEAAGTVGDRLAGLGVPVLAGLPFGHGVPQLTVPLGVEAELDADAGTLSLLEPALA